MQTVAPISKQGQKDENHTVPHAVSLTYIAYKLLEHIIYISAMDHANNHNTV